MKTTESEPARIEKGEQLSRQLTTGQLSMIAIGGAIGTGLFLGSSLAVRIAGPGVIVSYLIGAVIALLFMGVLCEMAVAHPTAGSFGVYAELYVNRMGGIHGSLHLLGGAMHRHRRRGDGHRHLLPVVVSEHAEMAVGPGIFGRSGVYQRPQRGQLRQLRILVRDDQSGRHRAVHRVRAALDSGTRARAAPSDFRISPRTVDSFPLGGAACGWRWCS